MPVSYAVMRYARVLFRDSVCVRCVGVYRHTARTPNSLVPPTPIYLVAFLLGGLLIAGRVPTQTLTIAVRVRAARVRVQFIRVNYLRP